MGESNTPRPRSLRKLRWALGLSLAVNLVIVGAIGGAAFRFRDGDMRRGGADAQNYAAAYVAALPREDRRAFRQALRREGRGLPDRAARRAYFDQVLTALRSPEFDLDRVQQVLDRQAEAALGLQRNAQAVWLKHVTEMSPPERAAYADRLEEVLKRGPRPPRAPER